MEENTCTYWMDWIVAEGAAAPSWDVLLDIPERSLQQSSVTFLHGHVAWRLLFLHSTTVLAYSFNLLPKYILQLHPWLNVREALTRSWTGWNSPFQDMFWYPVGATDFWFFLLPCKVFPSLLFHILYIWFLFKQHSFLHLSSFNLIWNNPDHSSLDSTRMSWIWILTMFLSLLFLR